MEFIASIFANIDSSNNCSLKDAYQIAFGKPLHYTVVKPESLLKTCKSVTDFHHDLNDDALLAYYNCQDGKETDYVHPYIVIAILLKKSGFMMPLKDAIEMMKPFIKLPTQEPIKEVPIEEVPIEEVPIKEEKKREQSSDFDKKWKNAQVTVQESGLITFLSSKVGTPQGWPSARLENALNLIAVSMVMEEQKELFCVNLRDIAVWLDVRIDNLKTLLLDKFEQGIDYQIFALKFQGKTSGSDSYPKRQRGRVIEEDHILTMRASIGLCMVSGSKGGNRVRGMMLDIMDMFKAGIRDPTNKIFNTIRECVGIKTESVREVLPDFSERAMLKNENGEVDKTKLSMFKPEQSLVAIFPEVRPDEMSSMREVMNMMLMKMVTLHEESVKSNREKNELKDQVDVVSEMRATIETLTAQLDAALIAGKIRNLCSVCDACNNNICKTCRNHLSKMDLEAIKKRNARSAFTDAVARILNDDNAELNTLGSALVGLNLWPNSEAQKCIRHFTAVVNDILGMLTMTHKECPQPNVKTETWMEKKVTDDSGPFARSYFEELYMCQDECDEYAYDAISSLTKTKSRRNAIAKEVKAMSVEARKAVAEHVIASVNIRPYVAKSLEPQTISLYYGDSAFAPLVYPTGLAFGENRLYLQLTNGHIVNPGLHHLIYGGRIVLKEGVDIEDVFDRIAIKFRKCISQFDIRRPATSYTCHLDNNPMHAPHHLVMTQVVAEIKDSILTILMPDGRDSTAKWRVWTPSEFLPSTALIAK